MVKIRSTNELVLSSIDFYRVTQPLLDTKPGTVARDLFIDGPANQLGRVYEELGAVSASQGLNSLVGADLDRFMANFGQSRQKGDRSRGTALLTFNSIAADIVINSGDFVYAKNGASYKVINNFVINSVASNVFRATATRYRADLEFLGITDNYAVEVLVEAISIGRQGDISKYSLNKTSIAGINNVTNIFPFAGGKEPETDAAALNRLIGIFSGANTGTALGYENAARSDPSVLDAVVIEPGDILMTRDGTQVTTSSNGEKVIVSEGTGGKVDIFIHGTRLQEATDTFIFKDKSNTGDPTNSLNDFVLGQIAEDAGKTVTKKRLDNLKSGTLPSQPVNNVFQVSGTLSGSNFLPKTVDSLGRVAGNYELVKDTGAFTGSPWGFDKIHWLSDKISDLEEDKTKSLFNGKDPLAFTDVLSINRIRQEISIVNENSQVNKTNKASIQLSHSPVKGVSRVFNVTTGERYVVSNQNPDGNGSVNTTGRILIQGQTLPATSDILQADYTWLFDFDPYLDFDNRLTKRNPRTVQDSIDWGFSNIVSREKATLVASGSFLTATVTHNISSIVSINVFTSEDLSVTFISNKLAIKVSDTVGNVVGIKRIFDGAELWITAAGNGSISGKTIFLPSDTLAGFNDSVEVIYNATDVYNSATGGNFNNNIITIVPSTDAVAGKLVECTYIANIDTILPSTFLSALPAIRSSNGFNTNSIQKTGNQPTTHIFSGENILSNLHLGATNLGLTLSGAISPGILTITGKTISYASEIVFTVSTAGLKQDLSAAIRKFLNLSSVTLINSSISVIKLDKVEKVLANDNFDVLDTLVTYDIKGYNLKDNSFFLYESIKDISLHSTEIKLAATPNNLENTPSVGDRLRVSFHISKDNDSENMSFSKSGILYTQKRFLLVDSISKSSGFISNESSVATLVVTPLNQPITRSRYKCFYNYTAPKQNERITIRYNYDRLATDVTLAIEKTRPINADVLSKISTGISIDATINIVVTNEFINATSIVKQNTQDAITSFLNNQNLGTTIDASDILNQGASVNGVDRIRILYFNQSGNIGSVLSIIANKNQFIQAGNITVNLESR